MDKPQVLVQGRHNVMVEKESIHSGHFMVSTFDAEGQDDEDNVAVPIPEVADDEPKTVVPVSAFSKSLVPLFRSQQQLEIDNSLAKLFQCMSLAYRQKLTSPKWNRFRGIRLRWKDKIRLNNVIWRCWHLQFIKKENTLICQFASPLDVDTHNKPEAVVLEGKYWKRKLAAVTAEYKKWRMFYRHNTLGQASRENIDTMSGMDMLIWDSNSTDNMHMMVDEDYMVMMSDTLFSSLNQPFAFPDSREIARAGLADLIQPSLGPLQPNLDDYMDIDPLQELMGSRLATVPEEQNAEQKFPAAPSNWGYLESSNSSLQSNVLGGSSNDPSFNQYNLVSTMNTLDKEQQYNEMLLGQFIGQQQQESVVSAPSYHATTTTTKNSAISKINQQKVGSSTRMSNPYPNYAQQSSSSMQLQTPPSQFKYPQSKPETTNQQQYNNNQLYLSQVPYQMQHSLLSSHSHYNSSPHLSSVKDDKVEVPVRRRGAPRGRQRSRSNTREPIKRPPLISAVSDPALLPAPAPCSTLLTQLLTTNSSENLFNRSSNEAVQVKEEGASVALLQIPVQLASPPADPLTLNTFSNSNSPVLDAGAHLHSPTSSQGSLGSPSRDRRVGHIHAEQKRRYNIKNGFDVIHSLIPHLNQNPNTKLSKAAMLQKGAEYIRQLHSERSQLKEEMDCLRRQIETLNNSISNCQSLLPATGAPLSRRRDSKMQEMFDDYVRTRTHENWKFYIFSLIIRPLLNSFNNFVSTANLDDLYTTTMVWIEQHCALVDLRTIVLNSLRSLCTKTDILSDPQRLPEEIHQLVQSNEQSS